MPTYVPGKVVFRKTWQPMDTDAAAYIAAVEAADTAAGSPGGLEERTKIAIDNFVLGCKADGVWNAIKASCILAGARTLSGALVPLAGTAPTNFNFVSGDYDRKTGLLGNGSTKYLNSNRAGSADNQNAHHVAVYASTAIANNSAVINSGGTGSGATSIEYFNSAISFRSSSAGTAFAASPTGFVGLSRVAASAYTRRFSGSSASVATTSSAKSSSNYIVYTWSETNTTYSNARLAFYSIGESLDLALLDARVTDLINAFGAAIP